MRAVLEAVGLTRAWKANGATIPAVAGVDLTVGAGELVAIVGPSGCGKSTLMHLLGLLLRADGGRLAIAGQDVDGLDGVARAAIRRRDLGFVFQSFNLLPHLSALDNVRIARPNSPDADERARQLLGAVGLSDRLRHRPSQLSVGEQQRVAIARAWINEPAVLLADEPTGNLDATREAEVLDLLVDGSARGQAVVVVTHSPSVARRAHRVLAMRAGRLESASAPRAAHVADAGLVALEPDS